MSCFRFLPVFIVIFLTLMLSACGMFVPPPVAPPPGVCQENQVSTDAEPCVARPEVSPATEPENSSDDPVMTEQPMAETPASGVPPKTPVKTCWDLSATYFTTPYPALSSQTTFKKCYEPGAADTVFLSFKLEDSTVTFVKPLMVFDIVAVNPDGSTKSMAYTLLDGRPGANPNFLEDDLTKEQLLAGLETSVAFKFKSTAPEGNYAMVISLFKNTNAYDGRNLVGRLHYDFQIKRKP